MSNPYSNPKIDNLPPLERFVYFIKERHKVYLHKTAGAAKPWTDDKILQTFRFCNVYRELDTVTKWIDNNWRHPHCVERNLWFAMVVARFVNWPDSLEEIGYPVPWSYPRFKAALKDRKADGEKVFTGAYIIPALGPKIEYVGKEILTPLWKARDKISPHHGDTLESFYERLRQYKGLGSFMAGQVVADIKYVLPLLEAEDWYSFAVPGPGSRRGLNRVLDHLKNEHWTFKGWRDALSLLHVRINPLIRQHSMPRLHAQDLQNCLCEFDKFERVRLGQGRPRSLYPGV